MWRRDQRGSRRGPKDLELWLLLVEVDKVEDLEVPAKPDLGCPAFLAFRADLDRSDGRATGQIAHGDAGMIEAAFRNQMRWRWAVGVMLLRSLSATIQVRSGSRPIQTVRYRSWTRCLCLRDDRSANPPRKRVVEQQEWGFAPQPNQLTDCILQAVDIAEGVLLDPDVGGPRRAASLAANHVAQCGYLELVVNSQKP